MNSLQVGVILQLQFRMYLISLQFMAIPLSVLCILFLSYVENTLQEALSTSERVRKHFVASMNLATVFYHLLCLIALAVSEDDGLCVFRDLQLSLSD